MPVDYEHELSNGWDKMGNLVLQALKDNKEAVETLDGKVDELLLWKAGQEEVAKYRGNFSTKLIAITAIVSSTVIGLIGAVGTLVWLAVS